MAPYGKYYGNQSEEVCTHIPSRSVFDWFISITRLQVELAFLSELQR